MLTSNHLSQQVIEFWFANSAKSKWFAKDPEFDQQITSAFLSLYQQAAAGELIEWEKEPSSLLALIILLDQFPRNMFRNLPQAFATDAMAAKLTKKALAKQMDKLIPAEQRPFLYMPLMHSEDLDDQNLCLQVLANYSDNISFAKAHRAIIAQFGRFPHRNAILNRESTSAEIEFLKQHTGF